MALFRKKPPDDGDDNNKSDNGEQFSPQPERARQFFDFAKQAAMKTNYAYALVNYAEGLKLDPESMSAHEAMKDVGVRYLNQGGKPASSKDIRKFDGPHPIEKFIAAEFAWMMNYGNAGLAAKALEAAVKAEQLEWGHWAADQVLALARREGKMNKAGWLNLMRLFREVSAFDQSMFCGNQALALDPTDNSLDHELKNLSAERAMDQGRYVEAGGKEGGFRGMVKDFDKQRELEESERVTSSASASARNLERARTDYETDPSVPDHVNKYAALLKKEGTPESYKKAYEVYMKGYEDTSEYRFRMYAGDLKIDNLRKSEARRKARLQEAPENAELQAKVEEAHQARLALEAEEYKERSEKYPTDRAVRYRLGEVCFELGDPGAAMEHLQASKDEPRLKVKASHLLGRCFAIEEWHNEAIEEFKEALAAMDVVDKDLDLDIRYDLMHSMIELAKTERDAELAREARDVCSGIARKNIAYRDIREKRREVDTLLKRLTSGESAD